MSVYDALVAEGSVNCTFIIEKLVRTYSFVDVRAARKRIPLFLPDGCVVELIVIDCKNSRLL